MASASTKGGEIPDESAATDEISTMAIATQGVFWLGPIIGCHKRPMRKVSTRKPRRHISSRSRAITEQNVIKESQPHGIEASYSSPGVGVSQVTIFISNLKSRNFADFENGPTSYVFRELTCRGVEAMIEGPACFFVDWVLPECSGLELSRRLRADGRFDDAPITVILEKDDPDDRRRTLRSGADSYMIAPLDRNALLDRVMLNNFGSNAALDRELIDAGRLQINLAAHRASWDGEAIDLPPNELRLLRYFAENANRVLSREGIIVALDKGDVAGANLRTVDVWIKRLRAGLRDVGAGEIVRTVQGRGYVLDL